MRKIDYASLAMFRNVHGVLQKFAAFVNTIPAFAAFLTAFGIKLKKLEELATGYGAADGDAGGEKDAKRKALCAAIFEISAPLSIFAVNTGDIELKGKVNYTLLKLLDVPVGQIAAIGEQVGALGLTHADALLDYGVTLPMRTALKSAIDAYNAVQDLPREVVDERAAIGRQIPPLIKEIKGLLKTNGDLFIKRFAATEPAFYYEYAQACIVVDPKVSHTELKGVVVSGANGQPLPLATVQVEGTDYIVNTGADGAYALRVEPGTYSVTISHKDYAGKSVPAVRVKLGQAVKVDAELERV